MKDNDIFNLKKLDSFATYQKIVILNKYLDFTTIFLKNQPLIFLNSPILINI